MLQKNRGIVLHITKYSDTSNIVDIYTEQYGRGAFLVKIPRSKKAAVKSVLFQPLSIIEFEQESRHSSSLSLIKEAKTGYVFRSLPYHPYKSAIALFLSEFLYRALKEEGENLPLFTYLQHSIHWLDQCEGFFANFHLVCLMRLSRFLGIYPNTEGYTPGDYFDLRAACFSSFKPLHQFAVEPKEAQAFLQLMRMNYETMHRFPMKHEERNRCLALINEYYRLHIPDFPVLKSLEVLEELFR